MVFQILSVLRLSMKRCEDFCDFFGGFEKKTCTYFLLIYLLVFRAYFLVFSTNLTYLPNVSLHRVLLTTQSGEHHGEEYVGRVSGWNCLLVCWLRVQVRQPYYSPSNFEQVASLGQLFLVRWNNGEL